MAEWHRQRIISTHFPGKFYWRKRIYSWRGCEKEQTGDTRQDQNIKEHLPCLQNLYIILRVKMSYWRLVTWICTVCTVREITLLPVWGWSSGENAGYWIDQWGAPGPGVINDTSMRVGEHRTEHWLELIRTQTIDPRTMSTWAMHILINMAHTHLINRAASSWQVSRNHLISLVAKDEWARVWVQKAFLALEIYNQISSNLTTEELWEF